MSNFEISGRLHIAAKAVALLYTSIHLLFLMANIILLYIVIGIPKKHEVYSGEWSLNSESNETNNSGLVSSILNGNFSLNNSHLVTLLTVTLLYFIMELFIARILYNGVKKFHLSKLKLWCDVRLSVFLVNCLAVCNNLYNWSEQWNYGVLNMILISLAILGLLIVKKLMVSVEEFRLNVVEPTNTTTTTPAAVSKDKATAKLSLDAFASAIV